MPSMNMYPSTSNDQNNSKIISGTSQLQFLIRPMMKNDYELGVLSCLSQLTDVGSVSKEMFIERYTYWTFHPDTYYPFVITQSTINATSNDDINIPNVIGTGMLMIERKLIHSCGQVGHIEDVVVHNAYRGNNLGKLLVDHLTKLAQDLGCYKVILDCDEKNKEFYTKCGYSTKGIQMAKYFI